MILLKDGVRYYPYIYKSEDEFATIVIEHYKEIFGENSLYFDPQTMKTHIGIEARSDGLILSLDENKWHILEVELAKHSLHKHIVPQITKFNIAYKQPETRKRIIETLYQLIKSAPNKTELFHAQGIEDIYKHLTELVDTKPTITIIIDSKTKTPDIDYVCNSLPFPTQTREFQTYIREKVGLGVHIHLFEPLCRIDIEERARKPTKKRAPTKEKPKRLSQVLDVAKLMHKGISYTDAIELVAKQYKISKGPIRAACTRELNITTDQFKEIAQDKKRLTALLMERYPHYKDLINETLA